MTEIKKLLADNKIPDSFLDSEVLCDYRVTTQKKKVWAIELDLLQQIDSLCKKYKLRYWAFYGTLLGAVRHKGFIPWDDDMDIAMPRKDYEKFLRVCIKELRKPYVIRSYLNTPDFGYTRATINNVNTTYKDNISIEKCGIPVDIFPFDGFSDCKIEREIYHRGIAFREKNLHADALFKGGKRYFMMHILKNIGLTNLSYSAQIKKISKLASKYDFDHSKRVGCVIFSPYSIKKSMFKKEWFDRTVELKFEYVKVPAPAGYKKILKIIYGNYMKFPPSDQRGEWHDVVVDADIPFTEYNKVVIDNVCE